MVAAWDEKEEEWNGSRDDSSSSLVPVLLWASCWPFLCAFAPGGTPTPLPSLLCRGRVGGCLHGHAWGPALGPTPGNSILSFDAQTKMPSRGSPNHPPTATPSDTMPLPPQAQSFTLARRPHPTGRAGPGSARRGDGQPHHQHAERAHNRSTHTKGTCGLSPPPPRPPHLGPPVPGGCPSMHRAPPPTHPSTHPMPGAERSCL